MARSTPRGHTDDSRETLIALTSRTSVQAVKESGLIEREGFASICRGESCRQGRQPCREACGEMACTSGDDLPGNPWWTPNGAAVAGVVAVVLFLAWVFAWLLPALAR